MSLRSGRLRQPISRTSEFERALQLARAEIHQEHDKTAPAVDCGASRAHGSRCGLKRTAEIEEARLEIAAEVPQSRS